MHHQVIILNHGGSLLVKIILMYILCRVEITRSSTFVSVVRTLPMVRSFETLRSLLQHTSFAPRRRYFLTRRIRISLHEFIFTKMRPFERIRLLSQLPTDAQTENHTHPNPYPGISSPRSEI